MPDHKETGREPTERERKTVFAPHQSPARQPDGDPGRKPRPAVEGEDPETSDESTDSQPANE